MEIQIRLSDGSFVSRYYTPILGNLTSFEIIVKMTGGAMTSYLDRQRPGDKQFKIRGPFGGPFVAPAPAGYEMQQPIPPKVVFITAGSGITPFLQFLTTTMLPLNEALSAWADYEPQNSDEIALRKGEFVATQSHYWDGWAFGTNLMTGQQGIFPLSIVTPKSGRNYKLILINVVNSTSEIVGRELLDAAMLSYPQQIEVHHVVASLSSGIRDGVTGYIREGVKYIFKGEEMHDKATFVLSILTFLSLSLCLSFSAWMNGSAVKFCMT